MSAIIKTNPVGVDWYIQQLQVKMYNDLVDANHLNLTDATKYEAYGRCYRNKRDTGYVAEVFNSSKEYKDVYWNDSLTAISFFGIGNIIKKNLRSETTVHFVMFADLVKLALKDSSNSTIAHRADEELRQMVTGIIGKHLLGFTFVSVELGIENVLREYPGSFRDERLKHVDMHPVHCFRLNLNLSYDENKNCQSLKLK